MLLYIVFNKLFAAGYVTKTIKTKKYKKYVKNFLYYVTNWSLCLYKKKKQVYPFRVDGHIYFSIIK